jgi:hypothetical protein
MWSIELEMQVADAIGVFESRIIEILKNITAGMS